MDKIVYREIEGETDAVSASELEKECLVTAWSREQISSLPEYAAYIAAFEGDTLCGIASMYMIAGEGQVMNVAVSPSYRRRGIANGLMESLTERAVDNKCENITLEVAEDNISAISLYKKCGFTCVGRRKGFYNGTDALLMEKKI